MLGKGVTGSVMDGGVEADAVGALDEMSALWAVEGAAARHTKAQRIQEYLDDCWISNLG